MVTPESLPELPDEKQHAWRLVNSKYPPINLFNDVADADEFETLYQIQALTNPRLLNEVGRLELIPRQDIPFGIPGCAYATAPFTHVNPSGSRFSSGAFGVLYLADAVETAIAEVRHHQQRYWSGVDDLNYERFVFRGLSCRFRETGCVDATGVPLSDPIYAPDDYSASHSLGAALRRKGVAGLRYHSVRSPGNYCWALLTPRHVVSIHQSAHYEMIWNGRITSVNRLSGATGA
ncbi:MULTISPECIES: RES family NAD+ phosphorylase [unclassified Pseudomonas]|uniref:RES family NAD+ phosphorylase n=1 Tax=unclassified Pseudomonas TaxID=196821 RepID=UPI000D3CCDEF|nr:MULTISPECIES: RES family NAD+ phosphorylase [unclassified Pseudomonas]RAU45415.1 RES domain-containing protein [Pseudomonas sp. RIT 409]RAU53201.1 RES domain-containing protein [Pseudomonas sp. RIT 412]